MSNGLRPADERYFEAIETELETAFEVANRARERGDDPAPTVEVPVAQDMADRVENILGIDGVAGRVRELEGERSREEAALELVEDFVDGTVGDYDTRAGKIEGAVRTAVALLTEGVVAAPIEGIDRVEVLENEDGTEFVNVYYAGPIRSAGGTAQALSVLVADYARALLGIDEYQPRDDEVGRYAEEVTLYDDEVGMQYAPGEQEARFVAEHLPVMLDGESTGDGEVAGFRGLERVDTDDTRGGMCLVFAEGIALKAPKIQRYTRDLDEVAWPWLQDLIDGTYGDDVDGEGDATDDSGGDGAASDEESDTDRGSGGPPRPDSSKKFLADLIAGRPVFAHPSEAGGFRLRYGRARNHGHATAGIHPATMHLVDDFLAPGTQIKTERPGKAAGIVPVDTIEGPTVRLASGEVRRIDDAAEARDLRNGVERILDLGEYLVNYGEFVENNHPLAPASYTVEWWVQEFEAAGGPVQALRDDPGVDLTAPPPGTAIEWASAYDAPLHPAWTSLWHDVSVDAVETLADALGDARLVTADGATDQQPPETGADRLAVPRTAAVRETLETLLVEHDQTEEWLVVPNWRPLALTLGFDDRLEQVTPFDAVDETAREYDDGENAIRAVNQLAPFEVRERAPTRVGARMGRPEKSEERELSPAVHTLFPIGEAGGNQRSVEDAASHGDTVDGTQGQVEVNVGRRRCVECETVSYRPRCPECGGVAEAVYRCPDCDREVEPDESGRAECPNCEVLASPTRYTTVDIGDELADAKATVGERATSYDALKGVKGLTSEEKVPEPLEKGILRAKHDVSAFKDGTVRYDMTDLPVTAVRPRELDVSPEDMQELGYREDIRGDPLRHDDQLVALKVQDIVLSDGAAEHMLQTADFVDDLLAQYYGLEPYYEFEERSDLVGELVFGMAPHTSAAVVGRVVGFTSAAVGYAHPYFHAAKRRNCFHPETTVRYDDDGRRAVSIEQFVEERLDDPRVDESGVQVQELAGGTRVPSLGADGTPTLAPVQAVSKHPAPDHLVRVETREDRSITVTPDHTMLRCEDGIETVPAHRMTPGDAVPVAPRAATGRASGVAADGAGEQPTVETVDSERPTVETVERVAYVRSDVEYTYCLTVGDTHRLVANGYHTGQCDGDEDCVMLLLDGLLNFSRKYLPDQRGGSVAADSRLVAVDPDGQTRFLSFEAFWEKLRSPVEVDGKFRKRTCAAEGWQTYAFDEDHQVSVQPIERAIRYRADGEQLLRVGTQFGRTLEITEDHSLFRYDGEIEAVAGRDLSEGDLVLAPRRLPAESSRSTVDIAMADSDEGVRQEIPLDEDFAWLLGAFVAGGSLSGSRPTIRDDDAGVVERVVDRGQRALGSEPRTGWSDGVCEVRFPAVLGEVLSDLGLGGHAGSSSERSVLDPILRAPRELVLAFLRGFVAGDGEASATAPALSTASPDVRDGLVYLLHRLGLVAEISRREGGDSEQPVYTVTVPGGASDEPLRRVLAGEEPPLPGGLVVPVPDALLAIREMDIEGIAQFVPADLERRETIPLERLREIVRKLESRNLSADAAAHLDTLRTLVDGDLSYLRVQSIESVEYEGYLYDLQVGGEPIFTANWLYAHNSMDAPLVMSSRIDPTEIDDEAHNVDTMSSYPRAFYEATREMTDPTDIADSMTIAEETLGTDRQYAGFDHTHDTTDIAAGPDLSAYKTLGSMEEKMDAQLALSRTLRAVDETDVAERIIEHHFLPDLLGNLKAFSSQEFRCLGCGETYRRAPLSGECRRCGGDVNLTVHEGSVTKYIDTAIEVAERFGAREYTKQRLEILETRIERVFEDDTNKASTLGDYM